MKWHARLLSSQSKSGWILSRGKQESDVRSTAPPNKMLDAEIRLQGIYNKLFIVIPKYTSRTVGQICVLALYSIILISVTFARFNPNTDATRPAHIA